jgi:hypothetical protein
MFYIPKVLENVLSKRQMWQFKCQKACKIFPLVALSILSDSLLVFISLFNSVFSISYEIQYQIIGVVRMRNWEGHQSLF